MIVDAQIHVWEADRPDRPWPRAGEDGRTAAPQREVPLLPAEVLTRMDAAGVDRAILVPPSWEGERNDLALAAARQHPGRFAVMGRVPLDAEPGTIACWREQPGMLGIRVILATGSEPVRDGAGHWLWHAAADAGLPMMIAPAGNMALVAQVARLLPDLRLTIDHMGARIHQQGAEAFADIDAVLELAASDNVSVKATCLPDYSAAPPPWDDVMPFVRRLFDAYGADRLFWGSDLSRLPCAYETLVTVFRQQLDWLRNSERDRVMGQAICDWLGWK